MDRCQWCGAPIQQKSTGRKRLYCDNHDRCRKAHDRAFVPAGMTRLPDPGPFPDLDPTDRVASLLMELRSAQAEAGYLSQVTPAPIAWRCEYVGRALAKTLDYCFGKEGR